MRRCLMAHGRSEIGSVGFRRLVLVQAVIDVRQEQFAHDGEAAITSTNQPKTGRRRLFGTRFPMMLPTSDPARNDAGERRKEGNVHRALCMCGSIAAPVGPLAAITTSEVPIARCMGSRANAASAGTSEALPAPASWCEHAGEQAAQRQSAAAHPVLARWYVIVRGGRWSRHVACGRAP